MADKPNNPSSSTSMVTVVEAIARSAGEIALRHFRSLATLPLESKGHLDLVTSADREVEEYLIASLREAFPEDGFFGEEGGEITGRSGRIWVLDPIDGTFNFVRGSHNWAVSIGLYEDYQATFGAVYAPARDLMVTGGVTSEARINGKLVPKLLEFDVNRASTGVGLHPSLATEDRLNVLRFIFDELNINFRCNGSSALSLIEIAMGETDGYVALYDSTWDVMAGLAILASLGVSHTIDWKQVSLQDKLKFACGSDAYLRKLRPLLEATSTTHAQDCEDLVAPKGDGDHHAVGTRPLTELRKRTVDLRGVADIRLMQVQDGPGRGQRLFIVRNSTGLGLEIAVDRGFDICSATWRGVNIGWNSSNNLPWPPHSIDAEDGVGFYRNLDGFIVTCGLDHVGAAGRSDATHFIHKHRKEVFNPLHGRISSQRATISGYGIEWEKDAPVIWAEAVVRQSSVFGENLMLRRRVEVEVFGGNIRINDSVENQGFRPTPHAILYHVNFGYPFLDETIKIKGNLTALQMEMFNCENKTPQDNFVDYFSEIPIATDRSEVIVELCNETVRGGVKTQLMFHRNSLPDFGIWRAFQSGVYALAFEPMRRASKETVLLPGERASYWIGLNLTS